MAGTLCTTMQSADDLKEAILASPVGVTWLAVLETYVLHEDQNWWQRRNTDASVPSVVERVHDASFGELMSAAVHASAFKSGPWMPSAPDAVADAYRQAERRTPILDVIVERFNEELHATMDTSQQRWFCDGFAPNTPIKSAFEFVGDVYSAGELPRSGLFTATEPPDDALVEMIGAWEYERGPVSRWKLPVLPTARIFEIHNPADWVQLVETHPTAGGPHPGWELPGSNYKQAEVAPLLQTPGQRAARGLIGRRLVPDWHSVATEYDGIHLSWAGFITSEGCITDLDNHDVTMLRYWFSERTLWLADVFGDPQPTPDPGINFAAHRPEPLTVPVDAGGVARRLGRQTPG